MIGARNYDIIGVNNMATVSVILPIYNAEPYLRQCLDSIKDQTLRDLEIICVNDGSTDGSLSIMNEYAAMDDRFVVLDKPNGGYGHSLNYGMVHAKGEYLAIVEPDDFIDSHMYEDLYSAACSVGEEKKADIVKGGYWEYYDPKDGYEASLLTSNLLRFMPKMPCVLTLKERCEALCHHPSIWSAIYRREFLVENDIRFVEPKGAGWADNPFFIQTFVLAGTIAWMPGGYYFYRQTNTGSSSFLKDFHVPFDRLREMRSFLDDRKDIPDDILASFYFREFDYIRSVVGEFGFDEADPEIQSLIEETLTSMKRDIVLTNPRIRPEDIRYYVEFFEVASGEAASYQSAKNDADGSQPLVTYIVPLQNDRPYLSRAIASIKEFAGASSEVLFVDCGSSDRSMSICKAAASRDSRFRILEEEGHGLDSGLNAALREVSGEYFFILLPRFALKDGLVAEAAKQAHSDSLDVVIFDESGRFCTRVARALKLKSLPKCGKEKESVLYAPVEAGCATDFLFNMGAISLSSKLYKTDFIKRSKLVFSSDDGVGGVAFFAGAMLTCSSFGYKVASHLEADEKEYSRPAIPFVLDAHNYDSKEDLTLIQSAFGVADLCAGEKDVFQRTVANLILDVFISDLNSRHTPESFKRYYDEYLPKVASYLEGSGLDGMRFYSVDSYNNYQIMRNEGFSYYISRQFLALVAEDNVLKRIFRDFLESERYKMGERFGGVIKRILPSKIVAKIRASIASR